ncbi:MAG: hypothetical protein IPJ17_14420 [Holophagales bacterium]|jgi:hypothetical protein|nr:MAG: hypothetical protein IPJ17_14420 [Holophagales bacterium]
MVSHLLLMTVYALEVAIFFALLWRRGRREQGLLFLQIFFGLMVGGLALGWLMYAFPTAPAIPFP